ncbi:MAG: hypothetical protein ACI854_002387 [Arenicella sp.]|jgi:hypothetical protein
MGLCSAQGNRSILASSDEYFLHLSKYIYLNPVEAKMVGHLDSYGWSSYPAFVGKQKVSSWLKMNEVYDTERTSPVLGDKPFADSALRYIGKFDVEVLAANRRLGKPTIDELVSQVAVYFDMKIEFLTNSAKGRGA